MEIIATIGPTTFNPSMIRRLWCAGVTIFRLNLSYAQKLDEINEFVKIVRSETKGKTCLDTHGMKFRLLDDNPPSFTKFDLKAIERGEKCNVDQVAVSFAQSAEALQDIRRLIKDKRIIAKIESKAGIENQTTIIAEADAILIDRGDLSRSYPATEIPKHCNALIRTTKSMRKPVYVATNLVDSMIGSSRPNMGEINDIASLLQLGVDGLVLAAETAIGKYPIQCVEFIRDMMGLYGEKS
jgi:pyruvate kinase